MQALDPRYDYLIIVWLTKHLVLLYPWKEARCERCNDFRAKILLRSCVLLEGKI